MKSPGMVKSGISFAKPLTLPTRRNVQGPGMSVGGTMMKSMVAPPGRIRSSTRSARPPKMSVRGMGV